MGCHWCRGQLLVDQCQILNIITQMFQAQNSKLDQLSETLRWLINWLPCCPDLTDGLTVWAAAAHRKKKKKTPQTRHEVRNNTEVCHTQRYAHTAAPALTWDLLAEHLVTSSWGKSSNYWHYCHWSLQPYSSQPFLQTRALSAVTAHVYHICLSPRWSRAMTEWPTTALTFPDLAVSTYTNF